MEQQQVLADLEYAKTLAEDGVKSPLVGGRFGLMWGVLLVITFTVQWAFLSGTVELPQHYLGFLWLGFGVVGGIGTFLLDRSLRDKPGLRSVGNRLDNAIWLFFSLAMAACFVGLLVYMSTRGADYPMFDTMVAIGFAGQGMAYGTLSQVTGQRWMLLPATAALLMAVVAFALLATVVLYLVAAIGIVFTVVLPSVHQLRNEPADVS